MKKEIVVGVTGASGAIYAHRLLEVLCKDAKVHIIVSDVAAKIAAHEGVSFKGLKAEYHENDKLFASIASGSYKYDGMVVIPCSSKTLAAIANGYADNLITRTADVCLKEGRTCILVTREMPFGKYQGRLMADLPGDYLNWFAREGFPKGEIGRLLALMHEIDHNGLSALLEPLRRRG